MVPLSVSAGKVLLARKAGIEKEVALSSFSPIEGVRFHANNNRFIKEVCPFFGVGVCRCLALGLLADNFGWLSPKYGGALIQAAQEGANAFDLLIILLILRKRPIDYGPAGSDCQDRRGLAKRIRGRLSRSFFALSVLSQEAWTLLVFSAHCK